MALRSLGQASIASAPWLPLSQLSSPFVTQPSLDAGRGAMLRGDGTAARRGPQSVLGAPLGDDAFVQDFVAGRASQARRLLAILDRLLLADPEAPATDSLGMYAPDEP